MGVGFFTWKEYARDYSKDAGRNPKCMGVGFFTLPRRPIPGATKETGRNPKCMGVGFFTERL